MSEATQTPDPSAAREAAMSRVTTLDDLVNSSAVVPPKEEPAKAETESKETEKPKKNSFSERITEVIAQRNAAEEEAAKAKREAQELREKLEALQVQADPIKVNDEPKRFQFATEDDYIDARAEWKAQKLIAEREQAQAEARAKAEFETVTRTWEQRCTIAASEIEDFTEAIQASEVQVVDYVSQTLLRSEMGPQLAYFFAKHPDEARKVNRMHPVEGIRYITRLEGDLAEPKQVKASEAKSVERSRAPEPISPVRQASAIEPGNPKTFAEYRAQRQAGRK